MIYLSDTRIRTACQHHSSVLVLRLVVGCWVWVVLVGIVVVVVADIVVVVGSSSGGGGGGGVVVTQSYKKGGKSQDVVVLVEHTESLAHMMLLVVVVQVMLLLLVLVNFVHNWTMKHRHKSHAHTQKKLLLLLIGCLLGWLAVACFVFLFTLIQAVHTYCKTSRERYRGESGRER